MPMYNHQRSAEVEHSPSKPQKSSQPTQASEPEEKVRHQPASSCQTAKTMAGCE